MVRTESPELKSTSDRKEKHSSNKKKSSASSPAGRKISFEQGEMNKDLAQCLEQETPIDAEKKELKVEEKPKDVIKNEKEELKDFTDQLVNQLVIVEQKKSDRKPITVTE